MAYDNQLKGTSYIADLTVGVLQTVAGAAGWLTNAMVATGAAIAVSKLVNRVLVAYQVADGTTVAVTSGDGVAIYTCTQLGGATLKSVTVVCPDAPSGGDLAFAVDVKKADVAAGVATVLSAPIDYSATQSDYEQESGTVSTPTIDDGDTLMVSVAVSGSTGVQGQGLIVHLTLEEAGS